MGKLKISLATTAAVLLTLSTLALSALVLSIGQAGATVVNGKAAAAAQAMTPIKPAACRGFGARCPPGSVWNGRRCVIC